MTPGYRRCDPILKGGIQGINIVADLRVGNVQRFPCEPFVKEPETARIGSGWLIFDDSQDSGRRSGVEQRFENREVDAFVLESEPQVARECVLRFVLRSKNEPRAFLIAPMFSADGREVVGQGQAQAEVSNKGAIASQRHFCLRQSESVKTANSLCERVALSHF